MGQRGKGDRLRAQRQAHERSQAIGYEARQAEEERIQEEREAEGIVNPERTCWWCSWPTSPFEWFCSMTHEKVYFEAIDNDLPQPVTSRKEREAQRQRLDEGRCIACAKPDVWNEFCTDQCERKFREAERLRRRLPLPRSRTCRACGENIDHLAPQARTCSKACRDRLSAARTNGGRGWEGDDDSSPA